MKLKTLDGRQILVGRPSGQSDYLTTQIETLSGQVLSCPAFDITFLPQSSIDLDLPVNVVVFVSPTAVDASWRAVGEFVAVSEKIFVAAVGRSTAQKLLAKGVRAFYPEGEGGADVLVKEMRNQLNLKKACVMIMTAEGGSERLEGLLKQEGAVVNTCACYRRVDVRKLSSSITQYQLNAGLSAWIATSRRAVMNLLAQFEGQSIDLTAVPLFVNHSAIAGVALSEGVKTVVVCEDAGKAMVQRLEDWFLTFELKK